MGSGPYGGSGWWGDCCRRLSGLHDQKFLALEKRIWLPIDMARDWQVIYPGDSGE